MDLESLLKVNRFRYALQELKQSWVYGPRMLELCDRLNSQLVIAFSNESVFPWGSQQNRFWITVRVLVRPLSLKYSVQLALCWKSASSSQQIPKNWPQLFDCHCLTTLRWQRLYGNCTGKRTVFIAKYWNISKLWFKNHCKMDFETTKTSSGSGFVYHLQSGYSYTKNRESEKYMFLR